MRPSEKKLREWLEDRVLDSRESFARQHVDDVLRMLESLQRVKDCPTPVVFPTEEGAIQMSWMRRSYELNVDVFPDGTGDWFARDRISGKCEAGDIDPPIASRRLMYHMHLFCDFRRASGDVICDVCEREYRRHPHTEHRDSNDNPYLTRLCDGDIVKL